jgi:hypothetical protein
MQPMKIAAENMIDKTIGSEGSPCNSNLNQLPRKLERQEEKTQQ